MNFKEFYDSGCIFILDTNAYDGLYQFPPGLMLQYLTILKSISDRIYIVFPIDREFMSTPNLF